MSKSLESTSSSRDSQRLLLKPRSLPTLAALTWLKNGWQLYSENWRRWSLYGWLLAGYIFMNAFSWLNVFTLEAFGYWDVLAKLARAGLTVILILGVYKALDQRFYSKQLINMQLYDDKKLVNRSLVVVLIWLLIAYILWLFAVSKLGKSCIDALSIKLNVEAFSSYLWIISDRKTINPSFYYFILSFLSFVFWFWVVLCQFAEISLIKAFQLSFIGVLKNSLALIIFLMIFYSLVGIAVSAFVIPLVIVLPWLLCSTYVAYQQIYLKEN